MLTSLSPIGRTASYTQHHIFAVVYLLTSTSLPFFSNLIFIIYGLQELCAYVVRFMNKFLKIVSQNDIFMDFSKLVSNEKLYN